MARGGAGRSPKAAVLARLLRTSFRLLWRTNRRALALTVSTTLLTAAVAVAQVLLGKLALGRVERSGGEHARTAGLLPVLVGLVAVSAVGAASAVAQAQRSRLLADEVSLEVRQKLLEVATTVDLQSFERAEFYDRLRRIERNTLVRPLTLVQGTMSVVGGLLGVLAVSATLLALAPLLVPFMLVCSLPLLLLQRRNARSEFEFAIATTPSARLQLYLLGLLTGRDEAKEVRALDIGPPLRERYTAEARGYAEALRRHVARRLRLGLAGQAVTAVVAILAVAYLVHLVDAGTVSVAAAGAAAVAVGLLVNRLQTLATGVSGMLESALFLSDLDLFAAEVVAGRAGGGAPVGDFEGVAPTGVHFSYPGSGREALRGIDFTVRSGEIVALVGENGSGKTTLAKIVAQLYRPTAGTVTWNGVDTAGLDPAVLRRQITVLFQDFVRYEFDATDNITLGRWENRADTEAVDAAVRKAGVGFLRDLPHGLDTVLSRRFGDDGIDLSGGQWQRVALARALFRDSPLVVLDEPTSAVDARAEAEIFGSMRRLLQGRAVVLISHRFSTVRDADRIVVLHEGAVVEQGTHPELMALRGRYAELYGLQADRYDPRPPLR